MVRERAKTKFSLQENPQWVCKAKKIFSARKAARKSNSSNQSWAFGSSKSKTDIESDILQKPYRRYQ